MHEVIEQVMNRVRSEANGRVLVVCLNNKFQKSEFENWKRWFWMEMANIGNSSMTLEHLNGTIIIFADARKGVDIVRGGLFSIAVIQDAGQEIDGTFIEVINSQVRLGRHPVVCIRKLEGIKL